MVYKEPADQFDELAPLPLPKVDFNRPLNIPCDMPIYSAPWVEHVAGEIVPLACYHDPNSDTAS